MKDFSQQQLEKLGIYSLLETADEALSYALHSIRVDKPERAEESMQIAKFAVDMIKMLLDIK